MFRELDVSAFRTYDPEILAKIRSAEVFTKVGGRALKDGTVAGLMGADIQGAGAHGSGMLRMPHSRHA